LKVTQGHSYLRGSMEETSEIHRSTIAEFSFSPVFEALVRDDRVGILAVKGFRRYF